MQVFAGQVRVDDVVDERLGEDKNNDRDDGHKQR